MAETLTSEQASQLATWYTDLSEALIEYRSDNSDTLSDQEMEQLRLAANDLRDCSTRLLQLALNLTLSELSATLTRIKAATDQMNSAIKHLQNVDKAIRIATAAVTLGAAIVSADPAQIAQAIGGAISAASS